VRSTLLFVLQRAKPELLSALFIATSTIYLQVQYIHYSTPRRDTDDKSTRTI